MILPNVKDFCPLGSDPLTGEVRLLLCHSDLEVFVIDTITLTRTDLVKRGESGEIIDGVCMSEFEGTLVIGIWSKHSTRFLKYTPPIKDY